MSTNHVNGEPKTNQDISLVTLIRAAESEIQGLRTRFLCKD